MELSTTARRAIEAYGGEPLWRAARRIEAVVSAGGLAFVLKRRPEFGRAHIAMEVPQPRSRLSPIGRDPAITGSLEGPDVRLEGRGGQALASRKQARQAFAGWRRNLYWDDLDMSYFANYAFWNYFTLPRLLMTPEIDWSEIHPGRLRAIFPASIPTHSRVQDFHFDRDTGLLLRHDYTVEIMSRLATAANVAVAHAKQNGIAYPSRREVSPQKPWGGALGWPLLLWIDIHELSVIAE